MKNGIGQDKRKIWERQDGRREGSDVKEKQEQQEEELYEAVRKKEKKNPSNYRNTRRGTCTQIY